MDAHKGRNMTPCKWKSMSKERLESVQGAARHWLWLFKQLTSKIAINREESKACLKEFKIPPFCSLWSDLFLCTVLVIYEYDRLLFAPAPAKPHLCLLPGEPPPPQSPAHTLQFASATGSEMDHLTSPGPARASDAHRWSDWSRMAMWPQGPMMACELDFHSSTLTMNMRGGRSGANAPMGSGTEEQRRERRWVLAPSNAATELEEASRRQCESKSHSVWRWLKPLIGTLTTNHWLRACWESSTNVFCHI